MRRPGNRLIAAVLAAAWLALVALTGFTPRGVAWAADELSIADLETKMLELVNKDRKAHQKKPLAADERLAAVARAHSTDMCDNRFFAHQSPRTGLVGDRLRAAKVRVMAAGENIAMNPDLVQAEARLMNSPGHRANILSEVFTHCGIGIARSATGVLYVTQVFGVPAPDVDVKTAGAEAIKKLNKVRVDAGKLPFVTNATLAGIAAEQAALAARAGKRVAVDVTALARAAGFENRRLAMMHVLTWNPDEVATTEALLKPRVGQIGVGVAENTEHPAVGFGMLWTVVIFTND